MVSRLELHEELCEMLGSRNVYFQPPSSVQMKYPAIRYSLRKVEVKVANDRGYIMVPGYEAILIDKNPDSECFYKLVNRPYTRFDRSYIADNLNHFVFTLY